MKMNVLLLLSMLTLTAVTFADDDEGNYDDYVVDGMEQLESECSEQLSLDEYALQMISEENLKGTEQYNCFYKCMLEKWKIINEKGEIQLDNYHEVIPKDDPVKEVMAQCRHIVVATCDDVPTLEKCTDDVNVDKTSSVIVSK